MSDIALTLRNLFWPQEKHKGKPVYLQETGEELGEVSYVKTDENGKISGYMVECEGVELEISRENILEGKKGFIYRPVWLTEAEEVIRRLEAQQRLNPDISTQSTEKSSQRKIKRILSKASPDLKQTFEEAEELALFLTEKREELYEKSDSINSKIEELAQRRMKGEGSRKDFTEKIVNLNRERKIIEENLNKVEKLYKRLKDSPLIDLDLIKKKVGNEMLSEEYSAQKDQIKEKPDTSPDRDVPSERKVEGSEKIKKVRIPKLEQEFGQEQEQLQENYISDLQERIKRINEDIKDLKELAQQHEGDENIEKFIDRKMENLKEEKKDIRDKIKEVKKERNLMKSSQSQSGSEDGSQKKPIKKEPAINNLKEESFETEMSDVPEDKTVESESGFSGTTLARLGSLVLIMGFIVLLILSLLRVF